MNRQKRLLLYPGMKIAGDYESKDIAAERRANFVRAGGDVICSGCGWEYINHPEDDVWSWLHVLCDGRRVKL